MAWTSWSDFWSMGGHGLYVWGSLAVTFTLWGGESALLALRLKAASRLVALRRQALACHVASASEGGGTP